MDLYDRIRDNISGLSSVLKDMNALTPEMHKDSDFEVLYNAIDKRMKKKTAASIAKGQKSSKADKPKSTDGSVSVNKIEIGGNVDGKIIIGNNNRIND